MLEMARTLRLTHGFLMERQAPDFAFYHTPLFHPAGVVYTGLTFFEQGIQVVSMKQDHRAPSEL